MKFRNILLSMLFLPLSAMAQTTFGYSNETLSRNNCFRYTSDTDQRLAMRLSGDKLKALRGKTISSIRIAFGSKNSTNGEAKLFLATSLDGSAMRSETISITSTNKLVEYPLSTPYVITGNEKELYVGCQLQIAANYGPFSSDFSKDLKDIFYAYGNGKWNDLYGMGYGCPNIEVVTSEDVELTDVLLKDFEENGYVKQGSTLAYTMQLQNFGSTVVNSFDVEVSIGDGKAKTLSFTDVNVAPHKTYDFTISDIQAVKSGRQDIRVKVTKVNGTGDNEPTDNQATASAYFYPFDMQKNVLLEVFTGQTCTNCPMGHSSLATAISQVPDVNVVEIAHHSGYVTDYFSMKEDWTLTSLYNGSTYAPAAMFNRMPLSAEASSPVVECTSASADKTYLKTASKQRPYVSIAIDSRYDASSRNVTLNCQFYTHEQMPSDELRYSIWLVQDGIVANQAGATASYVHDHVSRGTITEGTWGEKATFTPGETLQVEKTFNLPAIINSTSYTKTDGKNAIATVLENMKVVVFVHEQSGNDVNACAVFNCAEVAVGGKMQQGGFPSQPERLLKRQTYYGDVQGSEKDDVASRTVDYCYNAQNQLVRTIETSKNIGEDTWLLSHYSIHDYDAHGHLSRTHSLMYGVFDYDELGWLPANDTVKYSYNAAGQLVEERHPLKYYTYEYNAAGSLVKRSTWNINSITFQAQNDLIETYADFNSLGLPCSVSATSPSGKEWNEYTGVYTYDNAGNMISKKHYTTDSPIRLKYAEYWTYDSNGILLEHRLPTVFDDGAEVENEKEVFSKVDGDKDAYEHKVYLYNGSGWDMMSGSRRIDEYLTMAPSPAPELTVHLFDGSINTVGLSAQGVKGDEVLFYRNGLLLSDKVIDSEQTDCYDITDLSVKNGTYEYLAVIDGRASNPVTYTFDTPLRSVTNLHYVSKRGDIDGNTWVTVGWENPDYTLVPFVNLPFQSYNVFFENMRSAESTATDASATQLEVNFGIEKVKTVYVQTRYDIGYVNSAAITIDLDHLTAISSHNDDTQSSLLYNLKGQIVTRPSSGIYIKSGKKYVK